MLLTTIVTSPSYSVPTACIRIVIKVTAVVDIVVLNTVVVIVFW